MGVPLARFRITMILTLPGAFALPAAHRSR